jgi:hypothetical protein
MDSRDRLTMSLFLSLFGNINFPTLNTEFHTNIVILDSCIVVTFGYYCCYNVFKMASSVCQFTASPLSSDITGS